MQRFYYQLVVMGSQQDPIADPSLSDRVQVENEADPAAGTAGPREVLRDSAEPVKHDIPRGLETPGTTDGSATNKVACEKCGREVAGISADAPGRRTLDPCGHETGFLTAKQRMLRDSETTSEEYSLRTDGRGAPLTHAKPQHRRDRANSHWCEAVQRRRYCTQEECGLCGDEDGGSR